MMIEGFEHAARATRLTLVGRLLGGLIPGEARG
jgi:hypothetical protein